jgi:chromosome segregation ATPase
MSTAPVDSLISFVELASHWGSAQLYWPSIIAGGGAVLLCVMATVMTFDASRRVAGVPQWVALRKSVHDLNAERASVLRFLEQARTELSDLNEVIEGLRVEKNELERVRELRAHHEAELKDLLDALVTHSEDRSRILAVRAELRELMTERQGLQDRIAALREQHREHEAAVEKAERSELTIREQIARSIAERDAFVQQISYSHVELAASLRELDEGKAALLRQAEETADELQRLNQAKLDRAQVIGHISELRRRVSQLAKDHREMEAQIVAARAVQAKLVQENGRLEADRSSLWMEVASLHGRRRMIDDNGADPRHAESGVFGKIAGKLTGRAPEQRG